MKTRIKELAKGKGLTITALADLAGVTQATLSNTINEKKQPLIDVLEKVAKALDVEFWELFTASTSGELVGFIEYRGTIYKIQTLDDLKRLNHLIEFGCYPEEHKED